MQVLALPKGLPIFPYIGLIYSRYLQFGFLKWPLTWIFPYCFLTTMHIHLLVVMGIRSPYQPVLHHSKSFCRISVIEGSLELRSQTSDNIARWKKAEVGRVSQRRKSREKARRSEKRKNQEKEKMQMRAKVKKLRTILFFQWLVAQAGRKVGLLKRRVRSHLARWEMKKCTPLWREAHFQVKMYKAHHARSTFGSWDVEKVHAVVAGRTFPSQNVKSTISQQKPAGFVAVSTTTTTTLDPTHNYPTLQLQLHSTPLHFTSLHYTTLHSSTLHFTPLH